MVNSLIRDIYLVNLQLRVTQRGIGRLPPFKLHFLLFLPGTHWRPHTEGSSVLLGWRALISRARGRVEGADARLMDFTPSRRGRRVRSWWPKGNRAKEGEGSCVRAALIREREKERCANQVWGGGGVDRGERGGGEWGGEGERGEGDGGAPPKRQKRRVGPAVYNAWPVRCRGDERVRAYSTMYDSTKGLWHVTGSECASSRGASVRPSVGQQVPVWRLPWRSTTWRSWWVPLIASWRNPVYRWERGMDFLMVVSRNFKSRWMRDYDSRESWLYERESGGGNQMVYQLL